MLKLEVPQRELSGLYFEHAEKLFGMSDTRRESRRLTSAELHSR